VFREFSSLDIPCTPRFFPQICRPETQHEFLIAAMPFTSSGSLQSPQEEYLKRNAFRYVVELFEILKK
jgi:hypothetical protein